MAATGNASILFENTRRGGIFQTQQIQTGLMASRVSYYTPPGTGSRGNIQLVFEVYNTAGEKTVFRSDRKRLLDTEGEWSTVYFLEEVPDQFNGKAVTHTLVNAQLTNVVSAQVYLDDLVIYQYENSIDDMKSTIEQLGELGEFHNDIALHRLRNHLESLIHFMDHLVHVEADHVVDVEGRVHIPSSLPDGMYEVEIQVMTGEVVMKALHLTVNLSRNLMQNPGFETLENGTPTSWRASTSWQSNEVSVSPEAARTGEYGLKLWVQRDRKDNYYVFQNVNLEGGKTYELSSWLKSNIPLQGSRSWVHLEC